MKMAKNWSAAEAVQVIREGKDLEAIQDIGRRFPIFLAMAASGEEGLARIISTLPEHQTVRKTEAQFKNMIEADEDDEEEVEEKQAKKEKKATAKKGSKRGRKPKKEEPEEDYEDEDEDLEDDEEDEEEEGKPKKKAKGKKGGK